MQHEELRESLAGEPDRSFWTLANLAFVALMTFATAILIAGILLGPKTGLVQAEL
ncbi:MAG TPA: hypothetical protein VGN42_15165 [Pirellulales bacterium]|jgi:hypothetical protein|nr:hypothetical protein [Pirellulales bacterium]